MNSIIDEIKTQISILEAIERYTDADLTNVKTNKKQFNICCPLHSDKNPSLTIYTESNTWHCWAGCGGGDVINLVEKSMNISIEQAIKLLIKDFELKPKSIDRGSVDYKINKSLKKFNDSCKLYSGALYDLKLALLDEVRTIDDIYDLESKGYIYHSLARIEYLTPLLEFGNVEDRIYAIRKIGEMTNNVPANRE